MATVRRSLSVALLAAEAQLTVGPMPVVWGAAQQLTQLFQNLVDNAIKFRGTKPPEIKVTAEAEDEAWRFTVRDNGIGVDEPYREKVFLLFQRLHGRDAYPGSGIGLAVAKKIVEGHGGRIWIAATPGPGSGPEPAAAPTEGACVCFTISRAVSVGAAV
jgi:light-regulated signal transduction histidine kinase (bacteriophytochrome)